MVVLHGGPGFDQGYLRPGLRALAGDAQLVFVDLRGQGRSAPEPAESCTLEPMADDVAALCAALGIEPPIVFGHSAGGFVALQLALRHPAAGGRPDPLPHRADARSRCPTRTPAGLADRGGPAAGAVAARLFAGDFSRRSCEAFGRLVLPLLRRPGAPRRPRPADGAHSVNRDIAAHFFGRLAPSRRAPATRRDRHPDARHRRPPRLGCRPAGGRALPTPSATRVSWSSPDAGHFGFSETPQPFLGAVRTHLARIAAASPARRDDRAA